MKLALLFALMSAVALAPCQRYRVTNLGTLGGSLSEGYAIDAMGDVVGDAYTSSGAEHAFIFSSGAMHDLGTANGAADSTGYAVNDSAHVVGQLAYANGSLGSFEFANGAMTAFGQFTALGINDSDQIVGFDYLPNGYNLYAYLRQNGVVTNLGMPPGYSDAEAFGINASGQVVGTTWNAASHLYNRAIVWAKGSFTDLGDLGGGWAEANGINDSGQVVGYAGTTAGNQHAFLYSNGSMLDLGTLGGNQSGATAINASGVVLGFSSFPGNRFGHGFIWFACVMTDIDSLLDSSAADVTITDLRGINDRGYIAGTALYPGSQYRAILLTPYFVDAPTAYSVTAGKYVSGNLASLANADGNYLVVQSGPTFSNGSPPLSVVLTGTSTLVSPTDVRMQLTGHADSVDLTETVEFYDYVANAWVLVQSTTATTSDSSFAAMSTNPARFVQSGTLQMKARISLKPSGPISKSPWSLYLDQAVWNVSP